MRQMLVVTEKELRPVVTLGKDTIACVENAFKALSAGTVVMPPILRLDIPQYRGEVDVKTAYIPGIDGFAIKVSPGFFNNPSIGLPSVNGLMILLSAKTGLVESLFLDNGYLTDVRTAAAGAVAGKYLAREDARHVTILGAGIQARLQLEALTLVRPIEKATIWARDHNKALNASLELTGKLGIPVEASIDAEAACRRADIIVTTTPATEPILKADWISPGQHITAMGSDAEDKNEIDPLLMKKCTYVADSLLQTRRLGELHHAIKSGVVSEKLIFAELGQIVAGDMPGRERADAVTVCDLTGTGVQDTAIAVLAYNRCRTSGCGNMISN